MGWINIWFYAGNETFLFSELTGKTQVFTRNIINTIIGGNGVEDATILLIFIKFSFKSNV
jgi:hypothetical protein